MLPNKGMKLAKLSAAWLPEWTCRLMPAPAGSDAGTASQLIPGVRWTRWSGSAPDSQSKWVGQTDLQWLGFCATGRGDVSEAVKGLGASGGEALCWCGGSSPCGHTTPRARRKAEARPDRLEPARSVTRWASPLARRSESSVLAGVTIQRVGFSEIWPMPVLSISGGRQRTSG
jgi:hypothetical protein